MSHVQAHELGEHALAEAQRNHLADTESDTKKDAGALPANHEDLNDKDINSEHTATTATKGDEEVDIWLTGFPDPNDETTVHVICVVCRQSRRRGNKNARGTIGNRGNKNARGTIGNRGNKNARGTIGNRGNTQKGDTKVEAGKKGKAVQLKERDLMKKWNSSKKKSCNCPGTNHKDQCFMKWSGNGPRPYYGEDVLERHEAEWLEERKRLKQKRKA